MGLTIGEVLQQGVEAHKAGKLQDAERLYRSVLEAQPMHAGANHNLGVLAVSINKVGAALPFLKKAIDANPKIEQFWLSYIDALIKEGRLDDAREALSQAGDQSQSKEKLGIFEAKLASVPEDVSSSTTLVPAQSQINSLLKHYQKGEFDIAEELALTVTEEFPEHDFGWKVLGALYGQSGKASEAVNANKKAAKLSPLDPEVHSNLGVSLKELGQLEEARKAGPT